MRNDLEGPNAPISGQSHFPELQSLRGLAAIVVLIHHCLFYFDYTETLKSAAELAVNAHAAVVLFFVLSGYVLSRSLSNSTFEPSSIFEFYVRRIFRIYPALWFGLLIVCVYVTLYNGQLLPRNVTGWWFPQERREFPLGTSNYILTLLGLSTAWPIPLWTLRIELIASLALPLLTFIAVREHRFFLFCSAVVTAIVFFSPWGLGTASYSVPFLLGICILISMKSAALHVRSDLLCILLAVFGVIVLWFGRNAFQADYRFHYGSRPAIVAESIGAMFIVAMVTNSPALFAFLRWKSIVWLGDISYSVYLIHLPVLAIVAAIAEETLGFLVFKSSPVLATGVLLLAVSSITLPLATLSYRYIEVPGIDLGKRMFRRYKKTGLEKSVVIRSA